MIILTYAIHDIINNTYQLTLFLFLSGAETLYLLKELNKKSAGETIVVGGENGLDLDEMRKMIKLATGGMVKYLALVPPAELEAATSKFNTNR
jgi:uncharacterized protein YuzE